MLAAELEAIVSGLELAVDYGFLTVITYWEGYMLKVLLIICNKEECLEEINGTFLQDIDLLSQDCEVFFSS